MEARIPFWRKLVTPWLQRGPTPFYLFSIVPVQTALAEFDAAFAGLPVRHWLSCKTQPLPPLLAWWQKSGRGIEVVSEFELQSALKIGFAPEQILLNGPAKHRWLPCYPVRGLSVNFDSANEIKALLPLAKKLNWRVGIRLNTREEFDPETPELPTQFGFTAAEAVPALRQLQRAGVRLEMLHFHLRTNLRDATIYARALQEAVEICRAARFRPRIVDIGGGFPPPEVASRDGQPVAAEFKLSEMAALFKKAQTWFPGVEEFWLENGRCLSARSGVLVLKILDEKNRRGLRNLICDGGRTMNAMISNWESHELLSFPPRRGKNVLTAVNGPTCMAFDQITRRPLPASLRVGDHLAWMDAGAYHVPWETRFSHGWAQIYWHDGRRTRVLRKAESFDHWWQQWE